MKNLVNHHHETINRHKLLYKSKEGFNINKTRNRTIYCDCSKNRR